MVHKKRQILAASLVVALALAVAVNWYYTKSGPQSAPESGQAQAEGKLGDSLLVAGTTASDGESETEDAQQTAARAKQFFSDAKLRQAQYRDEVKDEIETLMESDRLGDGDKQKLLTLLSTFDAREKAQTDCETLIAAKLGGTCVVVLNGETAEVVVENGTVNETTALQIAEILAQNAQVTVDNLTIIEAK